MDTKRYLTVSQFCKTHEWAKPGGIRALLFNRQSNGFAKCIRRLGRKILLDEAAVLEYIDSNREGC